MGVGKKGRRKITYNDKLYVWYVVLDYDSPYYSLNIVSEDKTFVLACPLELNKNYVISKGNMFQGRKADGTWKRYLCPLDFPEIITPKIVSDIIRWAVDEKDSVEVVYDGKEIVI